MSNARPPDTARWPGQQPTSHTGRAGLGDVPMSAEPASKTVITCPAPYGQGGLGRHLAQLVEDAREAGQLAGYFASQAREGDPAGRAVRTWWLEPLTRFTPVRFSQGWRFHLGFSGFDHAVAGRLPRGEVLNAFDWGALASFSAARRLGYRELHLEAAMSHVDNVVRQIARARASFPIEDSPLIELAVRRARAEYAAADVIWVASEYTRRTFVEAGVPAARLRKRIIRVPSRFRPPVERPPDDGVFRVVYVGSLSLRKGVPILVEAFRRLSGRAELTLVGGSGTRGMKRYFLEAIARDPRVRLAPGDPLPHLHRADVFVHPTYEDGFGSAPMEALVCGVPLVVTEDTGMKEHVREGENGYIVPTGSVDAILDRLEHLRRHPLFCAVPTGSP